MNRVVVTGMGAVCTLGTGIAAISRAMRRGESALSQLEGIPVARDKRLAGQVKDPDFRGEDRVSRMAFHAVEEALNQSGVTANDEPCGLFVATVGGESRWLEERYAELAAAERATSALQAAIAAYPNGALADRIAQRFELRGPREVNTNACASGNVAIARALVALRLGVVRRALVVGADQLKPTMYWGAERAGLIGHDLRPFHKDREGTVFGDGAAALVLEVAELAAARGATPLVEVAGWGIACDENPHVIVPQLDGGANARAIQTALDDSGITPDGVDYFNAHGTGTVNIDRVEVQACRLVFGHRAKEIPVSATKSLTGHLSAASPVVEAIACILAIHEGFVHPTAKLDVVDPAFDLDFVPLVARERTTRCAVSNSMGGGGTNAVVVLCAPRATPDARPAQTADAVVITGAAVLTPYGEGIGSEWAEPARSDSARPAALRLRDFDVRRYADASLNYQYMNPAAQIGFAVAHLAGRSSGIDFSRYDAGRIAVVFGTAFGGGTAWSQLLCETYLRDPRRITPSMALEHGHHLGVTLAARAHNARGSNCTLTGGATAGLASVGFGVDLLRTNVCDVVIVGGMDVLDDALVRGLTLCGMLAGPGSPPCRPYDEAGRGGVYSECGAALVLERASDARARGGRPFARVAGFGSDGAPVGPRQWDLRGRALRGAMQRAVRAEAPHGGVVVFGAANGAGPADLAEASAVGAFAREVGCDVLLTSVHGAFGESFAASGLLGTMAALRAMADRRVPGLGYARPCPVGEVEVAWGEGVASRIPWALVNAAACGGTAASLLLAEVEP